jgi:hypothetical protein
MKQVFGGVLILLISVKQIYNFLFSAQDFSRNTAVERPEEGSQGWSTQRSGVRNPWIKEVLSLVALKGRQKWLIVEGAVRQSISKYSNLAQLQTTRLLNPLKLSIACWTVNQDVGPIGFSASCCSRTS